MKLADRVKESLIPLLKLNPTNLGLNLVDSWIHHLMIWINCGRLFNKKWTLAERTFHLYKSIKIFRLLSYRLVIRLQKKKCLRLVGIHEFPSSSSSLLTKYDYLFSFLLKTLKRKGLKTLLIKNLTSRSDFIKLRLLSLVSM